MAARAGSHAPVGSTDWILKEFNEISTICENELEDFTFSARNEVEWLNEHMSDIFSSNHLNLADIMKTPGKLRGKTPRTVRQRSPLKEVRQPLGEIAAINKRFNSPIRQSPTKSPAKSPPTNENTHPSTLRDSVKVAGTNDSGYHGEQDSMDYERELPGTQDLEMTEEQQMEEMGEMEDVQHLAAVNPAKAEEGRSTEGSFHSAKEDQTRKEVSGDVVMKTSNEESVSEAERASSQLRRESAEQPRDNHADAATTGAIDHEILEQDEDSAHASSENSTPVKTIVRKSSLTFAALPAREPLATKKSMGNRASGQNAALRGPSYLGRITGGKSLGAALHSGDEENGDDDEATHGKPNMQREESDGTGTMVKLHSKSSTQRLHERINALNKTQQARPTKSIPSALVNASAEPPVVPESSSQGPSTADTSEQPVYTQDRETSIAQKAPQWPISAPITEDAVSALKDRASHEDQRVFEIHQDEPEIEKRPSTTPAGSPPKRVQHGPLGASKSRLQSIMQSARGLFSSSAAASAQAKLEAVSVSSPKKEKAQPQYPVLAQNTTKNAGPSEPRRTRSSTEKEEKRKREEQELEKANKALEEEDSDFDELADVQSSKQSKEPNRKGPRHVGPEEQDELAEREPERSQSAMGPPARPRTLFQKSGPNRRPVAKPTKDQPAQKVSIKIGSMAGRRPLTAATLSSVSKGTEQARPGTAGKKESTASHSTTASSVPSFKNSTASLSKPKALLAAERKKEADEKAAQRKLEQKREMERRKAAQQEEAQRREQERQAAERQKEKERLAEEERKRQEQRQAVEKKRAEQLAKREQMQKDAEHQQTLKTSTYRGDAGSARPPSRQATLQDFPRPPTAQAQASASKAPKRLWNPDQDDEPQRVNRPQPAQNYRPTQESKRRKTDDEETFDQAPKRPTMVPPMRISNILKNGNKPSVFGNYPRAPPPASHHASAASQTTSQVHPSKQSHGAPGQQPPRPPTAMDIARFQNGAIPFANAANPQIAGPANGSAPFKTPLQASRFGQPQVHQQAQQPKSSPFINGEFLHLDDIPSDSEDEDSEEERERKANMPDWVLTPNLNQKLMDQEGDNPDAVFGPIAPLHMEEMFKDKKGQARFRGRTSSANWFGADRLTEEEKARDLEARAKIREDGGWSFGLGR